MQKPLSGMRVVDFTHVMAGPFATYFLGLLGAEVIKVESIKGDLFRTYGRDTRGLGMGAVFIGANAGKKSISLDLRLEPAKEAIRRLICTADVVVESFRPGVIDKLGFGYEACAALKSNIVYCSVSGYGQDGPMRNYPAIDNVVQATSGLMSVSGAPGDPPIRIGVPVVDTYTGTLASFSIVAALLQRERFGGAQRVDVAMMDASLVLLYGALLPYLIDGVPVQRTGNVGFSAQPTSGVFITADGSQISIGAVQQSQYQQLCQALDRVDLLNDERFLNVELRQANARALTVILADEFLKSVGADLERRLSERGVPCGLIRDVGAAAELPHVRARKLIQPLSMSINGRMEPIQVLNAGFLFAHDGPGVNSPPPRLGEHTFDVLASIGYSTVEIAELQSLGAIASAVV